MVLFRAIVALPLFVSVLMFLVHPRWMAWSALGIPDWLRWIGAGLGLLSVPAAWWVFRSLGRNVSETMLTRADQALVTTGPYRWVRHPLYATSGTLFIGVGLTAANWFILLFAVLAVGLTFLVVVPLEEDALMARFGDDYREYMGRTGKLLPSFIRRVNGDVSAPR
ncbi:MAG: methyltransferase [Gemmatimonadota bacterium]